MVTRLGGEFGAHLAKNQNEPTAKAVTRWLEEERQ
jgi:hypothetical protein